MVSISGDNGKHIDRGLRRNNLGLICYCYCIHTVSLAFPPVECALPTHWGCWLYSESGIVDDVCPSRNDPNHESLIYRPRDVCRAQHSEGSRAPISGLA